MYENRKMNALGLLKQTKAKVQRHFVTFEDNNVFVLIQSQALLCTSING